MSRFIASIIARLNDGRKLTDTDRFNAGLLGIGGRRLTCAEVTGKTGSEAAF